VGNNEHRMEGVALGHRDRLDAGSLWVYALRTCSRWQLLSMAIALVLRRKPREDIFQIFRAQRVTISCNRTRIGVGVDGEMTRMETPLYFESLPGALKVVAPASYPALT
jgi:diacylglycerol kinase family enzyme